MCPRGSPRVEGLLTVPWGERMAEAARAGGGPPADGKDCGTLGKGGS